MELLIHVHVLTKLSLYMFSNPTSHKCFNSNTNETKIHFKLKAYWLLKHHTDINIST